jgi:hypothetical protein
MKVDSLATYPAAPERPMYVTYDHVSAQDSWKIPRIPTYPSDWPRHLSP